MSARVFGSSPHRGGSTNIMSNSMISFASIAMRDFCLCAPELLYACELPLERAGIESTVWLIEEEEVIWGDLM
jgi:hypothetical protein